MSAIEEKIGELRGQQEFIKEALIRVEESIRDLGGEFKDHITKDSSTKEEIVKSLATLSSSVADIKSDVTEYTTVCPKSPKLISDITAIKKEAENSTWWIRAITAVTIFAFMAAVFANVSSCDHPKSDPVDSQDKTVRVSR